MKIRIESFQVYVRCWRYVVVDSRVEAVARAIVRIASQVFRRNKRHVVARWIGADGLRRLQVIDAAIVAVPRTAKNDAELVALTEPMTGRSVKLPKRAPALNWRIATRAREAVGRSTRRHFRAQIPR